MRAPLNLPTPVRLTAAAALCLAPLGTVWSASVTPGTTLFGDCGYSDGPFCVGDQYLPGSSSVVRVSQAPAGALLVLAAFGLLAVALTVRTGATRRIARACTGSVAIAAVLAANAGSRTTLICAVLALALSVPVVWNRRLLAREPAPR